MKTQDWTFLIYLLDKKVSFSLGWLFLLIQSIDWSIKKFINLSKKLAEGTPLPIGDTLQYNWENLLTDIWSKVFLFSYNLFYWLCIDIGFLRR